MHTTIFYLRPVVNHVTFVTSLEIEFMYSFPYHVNDVIELSSMYEMSEGTDEGFVDFISKRFPTYPKDMTNLSGMKLGANYNPDTKGPYIIFADTTMEISRDELTALLDAKEKEGTLKEFLDSASTKG